MMISDDNLDNGLDLIVILVFIFYFIFSFILRLLDIKGYWYSEPMFM